MNEKVKCGVCGLEGHILATHIMDEHGMALADYQAAHGDFVSEQAKVLLKGMAAEADNEIVDCDIKGTFGVSLGTRKVKTWMWKNPHATTPKIEPDYVFRPEVLGLLMAAHEDQSERILFTGPTGSGKSTGIEQGAARLNVPFYRCNLDNEVTTSYFVGQYILKGQETVFQYGVLPMAMRVGGWLLVDEWDMGNPGVTAVLQAVLEGKPLMIGDTGELVWPQKGFRIFATGNTIGQGDDTGLYAGTQVQNFAQLDRFNMVEFIDYPSEEIESEIIRKQCNLNDDQIKIQFGVATLSPKDNSETIIRHIVKTATLIRASFKKEDITATMSTRTLVNIGKKLLMLRNIKKAYRLCYLNKLNVEDRQFCEEIIQREWGV